MCYCRKMCFDYALEDNPYVVNCICIKASLDERLQKELENPMNLMILKFARSYPETDKRRAKLLQFSN